MDKIEFMNRLKAGLDDFPREEQENALKYYVEYFQEAGVDNEDTVIKQLGDPNKIIADIRKNYDGKLEIKGREKNKKVEPWIVALLVLASPFLFAGVMILFSLLLAVWSVILAFGIVSVVFTICGIILSILSFFVIPMSFSTFLFVLGVGLSFGTMGIFIGQLTWFCSKRLVEVVNNFVTKSWRRGADYA